MKEKGKCVIDKVYSEPSKATRPALLKFQNGDLAVINKETTKYYAIRQKRTHARSALVVANGNVYHGLPSDGLVQELTDSYICVRNRSTNKVRIIPIEQFRLNNQIYIDSKNVPITAPMSKESTQLKLLKEFGGRKASRYLHNTEKNNMNISLVKDELDTTIKDISINENNDEDSAKMGDKHMDDIRPKFNKDAKQLQEIYNVLDLVPQDLLQRLEEEAKVVHSTKIENLPIKSEYLQGCLRKCQTELPSFEGLLHIKLIIYMDGLLNLMKTRTRLLDKVELSGITEKVENDIRERFRDPNSGKAKLRTSFSNEKALCHFIVLAVLLDENYCVDMNVLAKELCISKVKINKFANVVCAKKIPKTDTLQLNFPHKVGKLKQSFSKKRKI